MSAWGKRSKLAAATTLALGLALAGCSGASDDQASPAPRDRAAEQAPGEPDKGPEAPKKSAARISSNVSGGAIGVAVDSAVVVKVADGRLDGVVMRAREGKELPGSFNDAKTAWTADTVLEPGTAYVVESTASDSQGLVAKTRMPFKTATLTLDEQTYANIIPLDGETVGVGMPVIVQFDVPVGNHAAFEKRMQVTSTPAQRGSWAWMSDSEAHWRPAQYWQPGTKVDVDLALNSVHAGNGIYGQTDRQMSFTIGSSVIMKANLKTDQMGVYVDGSLRRTIPITGGKRGYATRSGTKLIVEKFESKRMDATTVGVQPDDPEYYNIANVRYAQRVTFTGEFLHGAPWSVGDQGRSNVSHGCVGMSVQNAAWLFSLTHRGDPVEVTGTSRGLEDGNGWTDWNQSFADWRQGSAL